MIVNPGMRRALRNQPSMGINFLAGENLDSRITFTRASSKTYFDSSGTLATAATNEAPREYDPSTLACRGRSFWEARTNSIRNNTMVGAAAGTPGTMPTNWTFSINTTTGLTTSVVGTGTESGITYIDLRVNGTAVGAGSLNVFFEPANGIAATSGQTWASSTYWRMVGGSATGLSSPQFYLYEYTAAIAFIRAQAMSPAPTLPTSAALSSQRYAGSGPLSGGTTAFIRPLILVNIADAAAIDITLRIGLPQVELGATATPVIATSGSAVTRAADVCSMTGTNFSDWYNQTEGTFLVRAMIPYVTAASQLRRVIEVNDGTTAERMAIIYYNTASVNRAYFVATDGSVEQADLNSSSANGNTSAGTFFNSADTYKANDFAASHLGTATLTDTSGSIPTVTVLTIANSSAGTQSLNGWLSRIAYWNRRLPNDYLRALSGS